MRTDAQRTFFESLSDEDKRMLHCRVQAHLAAMEQRDYDAFAAEVKKNSSLSHAFGHVCTAPEWVTPILLHLPRLPEGPGKHRRKVEARLHHEIIGCPPEFNVKHRQLRRGILQCSRNWITAASLHAAPGKPAPIHVVSGASGSGKTTYCAFDMAGDFDALPAPERQCTIVLVTGDEFNQEFRAAAETADEAARNKLCIRTVVAAVSRAMQSDAATENQTLYVFSDAVMFEKAISWLDLAVEGNEAVKKKGPFRASVLIVIDEIGEAQRILSRRVCGAAGAP